MHAGCLACLSTNSVKAQKEDPSFTLIALHLKYALTPAFRLYRIFNIFVIYTRLIVFFSVLP